MQAKFKWLLLPPAIALVLFLGPLQSATTPRPDGAAANADTAAGPDAKTPASKTRQSPMPELPDFWQVGSTLIGVLLLGVAGIALFKRLRLQRPLGGGEHVVLRQSLRLSQRHTVHAVEFDGAMLLVGEVDGTLAVLRDGKLQTPPEAEQDEAELRRRRYLEVEEDPDDDGAVPRDLVIPRPSVPPRRTAPTQPQTRPAAPAVAAKLANFKNLLAKAGAGSR